MGLKLFKHLITIIILICLIALLVGKIFFTTTPNKFLLAYGIAVTTVVLSTFIISLRYKDPSIELRKKNLDQNIKKPFISCVFAVRNEEKLISRCLSSVLNSDYEPKEVIVVNDASTDGTKEILDQYKGIKNLKIIHLTKN